ncbi:GNAT family N-acetyltransferase [Paenibacillus oleatilyticus]|uniref:GNAT family N-acetyltransferase n=1 Tax=Paenibacillus oleatilyticus TaxID=2594886 RepID=UPI001C1FAD2F|nr:GNAT family N-acetyltransferase [Paenibacillus oleatilyticus]MBU7315103.1 GNAT family N-acetyltransferase [Paenibacillus oleatilyticus]
MKVASATMDDLKGWLELASEVEYLFGPMVNDPKFIQALEKNINQDSAYCVRENDGLPGSKLLGGILFSASNAPKYKIGWLSVSSKARNKGIATALVGHVLRLITVPSEVVVITFGDDIPDGQPARKLYQKFGFIPLDELIPNGPEGGSRQKFKLDCLKEPTFVKFGF